MMRSIGYGIAVLLCAAAGRTEAADSAPDEANFALYFDDAAVPARIHDSMGSQDFGWIGADTVEISTKVKKFGTGSLRVPDEFRIQPRFTGVLAEAVSGEIRRMSMVVWVRLPEGASGKPIGIAGRSGNEKGFGQWRFYRHSHKLGLAFSVGEPTNELVSMGRGTPVGIPAGEWTHLAMVFDDPMVRFFINGVELSQRELSRPGIAAGASAQPLRLLGGLPAGSYVDDFGYFGDTALNPEELRTIVESGLQPFMDKKPSS